MAKQNSLPHVVIVGAGFGGLNAARTLRNSPARITLIDRSNYHLFQPLLYQVATAGLSPADIATPIRAILRNQLNTEVVMGEVTAIDSDRQVVRLSDHEISYDYLVLATGARHGYFAHPEWEKFAPGLKSIEDATTIRRKILVAFESAEIETDDKRRNAYLNFVLVGGGATGVEMAGSIAELAHKALASDFRHIDPRAARVILLEAGPRILAAFDERLAQDAQKRLEKLGVEVRAGSRVEQIDADGVVVSGQRIQSKTIIWAAGVLASPAAKWLKTEADRNGRVIVLDDLSVPGHKNIFVIGDTASVISDGGKPLPGVAPVAMQQGKYVGGLIKKKIFGLKDQAPFRYRDKGNLATVGRSAAIAEFKGIRLTGFIAWVTWLVVHIFYLIGFRNRVLVMLEWAWAYLTFQRGARLITAKEK